MGLAKGVQRSFRPFPRQRTYAPAPSETSSCRNAVISLNRKAGLNGGEQKGVVAAPQPLRSIRRRQQRLNLGPSQRAHQCAPLSLVRNRQHSLDDSAVRRRFQRSVAKKRPDGGQTEVPASGAIVTAVLQIFQERPDQSGIQIAEPQLRRGLA